MTEQPGTHPGQEPGSAQSSTPAHSRGAIDLSQVTTGTTAGTGKPAGQVSAASWMLPDVADQNQLQKLLQLASQVPVIIHLASPSNPTSTAIDQVLGDAIDHRGGRMVGGRIDGEAHPELLQPFGIPAGPMVLAVIGGQAMPLFKDPVERGQLDALLDELNSAAVQNGMSATVEPLVTPTDADGSPALAPLHQKAEDAMMAGDLEAAKAAYQEALNENPGDEFAASGMKSIELLERTRAMDAQAVRTKAADEPDNVQAQIDVADLDVLGGHVTDGFNRLVRFIGSHFGEDRETARAHLVELYSIVGDSDPRVTESRKKLAMALF